MRASFEFKQRVRELVNDPVFSKPIKCDKQKHTGNIILVTRIKPKPNNEILSQSRR